jgi:hypothetical protein
MVSKVSKEYSVSSVSSVAIILIRLRARQPLFCGSFVSPFNSFHKDVKRITQKFKVSLGGLTAPLQLNNE